MLIFLSYRSVKVAKDRKKDVTLKDIVKWWEHNIGNCEKVQQRLKKNMIT